MSHAFISYSRKDTPFVEKLESDLRLHGIQTWRDQHSIAGGEEWYKSIVSGIEDAFALIAIVSPSADESRWVLREQLYADQKYLPRVPVLPNAHPIPFHMQELNPILCDAANYNQGIQQLVSILNGYHTHESDVPTDNNGMSVERNEELEYLRFLKVDAESDIFSPRYVALAAVAEDIAAPRPPTSRRRMTNRTPRFQQLGLEIVEGDAFDRPGQEITDARIPLRRLKRTLLLGEPGSGKTTTLWQLAIDLAETAEKDTETKLPVFVPLAGFTGETSFAVYVQSQMATIQSRFETLLSTGRLILLCDAFNEMPRYGRNGTDLVSEVKTFLSKIPEWVISCRIRDYQEDLADLSGVSKLRLKSLTLPQIYEIIQRRFSTRPQTAASLWKELCGNADLLGAWMIFAEHGKPDDFWLSKWSETIVLEQGKHIYSTAEYKAWKAMQQDNKKMMLLCRNPYLLFLVCELFERTGSLPQNRGALFASFVDELLAREEHTSQLNGSPWIPTSVIAQELSGLAFAMQRNKSGTEISVAKAQELITSEVDATLVLRIAASASIIELSSTVRFTHQLLQEYFASGVLGRSLDEGKTASEFWPKSRWWRRSGWEETAVILAGLRDNPEEVARWIANANPEIALQVLQKSGTRSVGILLDENTRKHVVTAAQNLSSEPDPVGRAAAYRVLGELGADERFGIGVDSAGLPQFDWVKIPAGSFTFGFDKNQSSPTSSNELAQSVQELPDFYITRYPVTYSQFYAFVSDPVHIHRRYWEYTLSKANDEQADSTFDLKHPKWRLSNHPVVSVSWHEVWAFSVWVSEKLGYEVRLPTEYEWEKAARGTDGRIYPYGNKFEAEKCNTKPTGIGRTSAVGILIGGASPFGVMDCSGNVWEYTLDLSTQRGTIYALDVRSAVRLGQIIDKGGGFTSNEAASRCTYRIGLSANERGHNLGFRLVTTDISS